jgi:hypothetical protein
MARSRRLASRRRRKIASSNRPHRARHARRNCFCLSACHGSADDARNNSQYCSRQPNLKRKATRREPVYSPSAAQRSPQPPGVFEQCYSVSSNHSMRGYSSYIGRYNCQVKMWGMQPARRLVKPTHNLNESCEVRLSECGFWASGRGWPTCGESDNPVSQDLADSG